MKKHCIQARNSLKSSIKPMWESLIILILLSLSFDVHDGNYCKLSLFLFIMCLFYAMQQENVKYLPGIKLGNNVIADPDLENAGNFIYLILEDEI